MSSFKSDTPAAGQEFTREELVDRLITPLSLRHGSAVMQMNPNVILATRASRVRVPKLTSLTVPGSPWIPQGTLIPEADGVIGELVLLPPERPSLKVLLRVTSELIGASPLNLLDAPSKDRSGMPPTVVSEDARIGLGTAVHRQLARELDGAMLIGTGAGDTITGIRNTTGIGAVAIDGPLTLDDLHDALTEAQSSAANPSHWLMHPRALGYLRRLKDGDGRYQLDPDPKTNSGVSLLGLPVVTSVDLPDLAAVGGAFVLLVDREQIYIAVDEAARFEVSEHASFDTDEVLARLVMRADLGLANPEGVIVLTGITAGP